MTVSSTNPENQRPTRGRRRPRRRVAMKKPPVKLTVIAQRYGFLGMVAVVARRVLRAIAVQLR